MWAELLSHVSYTVRSTIIKIKEASEILDVCLLADKLYLNKNNFYFLFVD
jgi:hypothetical protein